MTEDNYIQELDNAVHFLTSRYLVLSNYTIPERYKSLDIYPILLTAASLAKRNKRASAGSKHINCSNYKNFSRVYPCLDKFDFFIIFSDKDKEDRAIGYISENKEYTLITLKTGSKNYISDLTINSSKLVDPGTVSSVLTNLIYRTIYSPVCKNN